MEMRAPRTISRYITFRLERRYLQFLKENVLQVSQVLQLINVVVVILVRQVTCRILLGEAVDILIYDRLIGEAERSA